MTLQRYANLRAIKDYTVGGLDLTVIDERIIRCRQVQSTQPCECFRLAQVLPLKIRGFCVLGWKQELV